MEEVSRKVQKASTHSYVLILRAYKGAMHRNVSQSKHPIGAMDEVGKGQKANTHASTVGVYLAGVEGDSAIVHKDATSRLPNNEGTSVKASTPSGRWGGFMKASTHVSSVGVDVAAIECD